MAKIVGGSGVAHAALGNADRAEEWLAISERDSEFHVPGILKACAVGQRQILRHRVYAKNRVTGAATLLAVCKRAFPARTK